MKKKRRRKFKYRLTTGFKRFLIVFLFILGVAIYANKQGYALYLDYEYRKTDEYKMLKVGYSLEEINYFNTLPENKTEYFLSNPYNEMYYKIVTQKYYLDKNFYKYVNYKIQEEDIEYDKLIALVNVHANSGWYNETYDADVSLDYGMLVNKFYKLDGSYVRDDLINVNLKYAYAGQIASKVVIENFDRMWNDVKTNLNIHLMINSSYRPYADQEAIYNDYKVVGQKYADSYAARPGNSEHQTGLAIDLTSLEHPLAKDFTLSEEYEWLKNNCHKYGFILRYPEGKEDITGYNTESWHFRYVGEKIAKQIYEEGITLDEYYAYYVEK